MKNVSFILQTTLSGLLANHMVYASLCSLQHYVQQPRMKAAWVSTDREMGKEGVVGIYSGTPLSRKKPPPKAKY